MLILPQIFKYTYYLQNHITLSTEYNPCSLTGFILSKVTTYFLLFSILHDENDLGNTEDFSKQV